MRTKHGRRQPNNWKQRVLFIAVALLYAKGMHEAALAFAGILVDRWLDRP